MIQFTTAVKYLGTETKSGVSQKTGKPYEMTEAKLFIPELGRVKVPVRGKVKLPDDGASILLDLSVDQGSFQALQVVWDESTKFKSAP